MFELKQLVIAVSVLFQTYKLMWDNFSLLSIKIKDKLNAVICRFDSETSGDSVFLDRTNKRYRVRVVEGASLEQ